MLQCAVPQPIAAVAAASLATLAMLNLVTIQFAPLHFGTPYRHATVRYVNSFSSIVHLVVSMSGGESGLGAEFNYNSSSRYPGNIVALPEVVFRLSGFPVQR